MALGARRKWQLSWTIVLMEFERPFDTLDHATVSGGVGPQALQDGLQRKDEHHITAPGAFSVKASVQLSSYWIELDWTTKFIPSDATGINQNIHRVHKHHVTQHPRGHRHLGSLITNTHLSHCIL